MKITDTLQTKVTIWQKQTMWRDFSSILIGAAILVLFVAFGEEVPFLRPVRVLLGLMYVFLVPGYCLTTALFPRINDLDTVERLSLSIGFSVAAVSILALGLDWLHWGLHPWPILLSEIGITGLFMAVTFKRLSQLASEQIYMPEVLLQPSWRFLAISNRRLFQIFSVALIIVLLGAWVSLTPVSDRFMTEFYILGPEGKIADYPYQVELGDEVKVNVGLINREKNELNYHYEVWVANNLNPNRRQRLLKSASFVLRPGEKLEFPVSWYMPWVGEDQIVELFLFSKNDPEPYRRLRMWINVQE